MKTPKSRKRTLASWALAGTLGLAGPVAAQVASKPLAAPVPANAVRSEAAAPGQTDTQGRLESIQIELAWLADPVTFPYNLGVYPSGSSFEVRGFVPTEAVRTQAIKIARAHTRRAVTDGIKVYPGMAVRSGSESAEKIVKATADVLTQALGERGRSLTIRAKAGGQVTLQGTVGCHEEKLLVSRQMRKVTGCTSSINELSVVTVLREGKLYHLVTMDGQVRIPAHSEVLHVNHSTPRTQAQNPPPRQATATTQPVPPKPGATAPVVATKPITPPAADPRTVSSRPEVSSKPPATNPARTVVSSNPPRQVPTTVPAPQATKPPAQLMLTSHENVPEIKPGQGTSAQASSLPNGPRVVMVKMLENVPGSVLPVERMVPVLLSGNDRLQATRPLTPEEAAMYQNNTQGVTVPRTGPTTLPPTTRPLPTDRPPPRENLPEVGRTHTPPQTTITNPRPILSNDSKPVDNGSLKPMERPESRPVEFRTIGSPPTPPLTINKPKEEVKPASPTTGIKEQPLPPATSTNRLTSTNTLVLPRSPLETTSNVQGSPPLNPVSGLEPRTILTPTPSASQRPAMPAPQKIEPAPTRTVNPPKPAGTTSVAPYVSRGTVTFDDVPPPAPVQTAPQPLAQLRSRIEAACAGVGRDVEIVSQSGNALKIQLKVSEAIDAPKVSEKILNLPELAPYEVSLEVKVMP